ncbi:MAG: indolepyruvate oxidoreductase subunit beta [Clostridia bacterium]|nr:indolepyruvate oxidoreductase subunit beta [Clostridia bacterium]MBQ4245342.1 indolepyruvate oxidoreductase subunit beta [Clostridia bacterium]
MNKSVMIVGVGGQGTLLASRILGAALLNSGFTVKLSEVHGMSQRGGSVVTYVKYGEEIASPIIEKGEADIILAFEQLEAARWLEYMKPDGQVIVNTQKIDPMSVVIGDAVYPDGVIEAIEATGAKVLAFDALPIANEAGSSKAVNVVLIGAMAKYTDIPKETWIDAVKECVPAKFLDLNLKAFELGYNC